MTVVLARLLDVIERKPDERLSINAMWHGRFQSRIVTVAEAPEVAAKLVATDCWYGTGVLHERVTTGRGYARDVIGVRELYADLDYKPGALTPDTARAVIDDLAAMLAAAPVAIVQSGGGVQPHWTVERSDATDWPDETDSMHGITTALWRRWGRLVRHVADRHGGAVDGVYDLSRVLRVPGTVNTKYDPPRPVTVEYPGGAPVTLVRLAETLDEYDVPELPGDREILGEVAPPTDWRWAERTCQYVIGMVAGWGTDAPKDRHPWLMQNAVRLAAAHRAGCITAADHASAIQELAGRFHVLVGPGTAHRPGGKTGAQPGEITEALSWGIGKASMFDQARAWKELGSHHDKPTTIEDTGFWDTRPELAHIRTYAQAQMASAWGVLAVVLARVVCQAPVRIALPAVIYGPASLNLTVALVAESGGGKDGSSNVAAAAVRIDAPAFDTHTLGSGQGIAHGYGHYDTKEKQAVRHADSVLFTVEEVDHLAGLNAQNGSTTFAELRRFGMGEKLGHLFVDPTKRVQIAAHTYRGAVVVGVQPGRAGVILDATDGGTPQRFFWVPASAGSAAPETEPDRPDPWLWTPPSKLPDPDRLSGLWPIPVCDTATKAIRQGQRDRNAGKLDALDGHSLLTRERIAAALGLLNGHYGVTDEDWALAGTAMAVSDSTRARVIATLAAKKKQANMARAEAEGDRAAIVVEKVTDAAIKRACKGIVRYLTGRDWVAGGEIRRHLDSSLRKDFDTAAGMLTAAGQIEPEPLEYQGQTGRRYRLSDRAER